MNASDPRISNATHDEIMRAVGALSDAKVAAIEATGASLIEIEEAVAWVGGESDVMGKQRIPLTGVVAAVSEILTTDEELDEARE